MASMPLILGSSAPTATPLMYLNVEGSLTVEDWLLLQPGDEVVVLNNEQMSPSADVGTLVRVARTCLNAHNYCVIELDAPLTDYYAGRFGLPPVVVQRGALSADLLQLLSQCSS